jgi:hypothetical protein
MDAKDKLEKYIKGNIVQSKVLLDMGFSWENSSHMYLYFIEDLSILKFLHSLEIPFGKDLLTKVINRKVPIETLKWLRYKGAYWDEKTFETFLIESYCHNDKRVEILKWLIKEDCPRKSGCLQCIFDEWGKDECKKIMWWVIDGCP